MFNWLKKLFSPQPQCKCCQEVCDKADEEAMQRERDRRFHVVEIYTDGSCVNNGTKSAQAAWAFYVPRIPSNFLSVFGQTREDGDKQLDASDCSGNAVGAGPLKCLKTGEWHSNNKAEFMAIIEALKWATGFNIRHVKIITDSKYVIDVLTGLKNAHLNLNYIEAVRELVKKFESVKFEWISSHAGDKYNEEVDRLARKQLGLPDLPHNRRGQGQYRRGPSNSNYRRNNYNNRRNYRKL